MTYVIPSREFRLRTGLDFRRREPPYARWFDATADVLIGASQTLFGPTLDAPFKGLKKLSYFGWMYADTDTSGVATNVLRRDGLVNIQRYNGSRLAGAIWTVARGSTYCAFGRAASPTIAAGNWYFFAWSWDGDAGSTVPLMLLNDTVMTGVTWSNGTPNASDSIITSPSASYWALGGTYTNTEHLKGGIGPQGYFNRLLTYEEMRHIREEGPWAFADNLILLVHTDPRHGLPIWYGRDLVVPSEYYGANLQAKMLPVPTIWPKLARSNGSKFAPVTAQTLVPNADVSAGGWVNELGASSPLWSSVDEQPASATDYIQSPTVTPGATVKLGLTDPTGTGPVGSGEVVINVRRI